MIFGDVGQCRRVFQSASTPSSYVYKYNCEILFCLRNVCGGGIKKFEKLIDM